MEFAAMTEISPRLQADNISLTNFHNNMSECLDLALRQKVTLTKHGRAQWHVTEASYLERIEALARGEIFAALGIRHQLSSDLDEATRARILAQMPTDAEVESGRWNDA